MNNKTTTSIAIITLLCGLCACTEEVYPDSAADDMLESTGVTTEDFGSVGEASSSEVKSSAIEGTWVEDDEWQVSNFEFNADGTLEITEDEDGELYKEELTWALEGNVLLVQGSESEQEDGLTCTESYIEMETVAIVDGMLYTGVYIRTSGNGSDLDGTWESFSGEQISLDCGEFAESDMEVGTFTLRIDGATFVETKNYRDLEVSSGNTESGEGTGTTEGVVEEDGTFITLKVEDLPYSAPVDPSDPQAPENTLYNYMSFARVSDDVLVVIWPDEYDSPEAALSAEGMEKQ